MDEFESKHCLAGNTLKIDLSDRLTECDLLHGWDSQSGLLGSGRIEELDLGKYLERLQKSRKII